jgi:hypothetical protein
MTMPVYTQAPLPLIPTEDELIRSFHASGILYKDIADRIGNTTSYVRNYCWRHQIRRQAEWTDEQLAMLRSWYADHSGKKLEAKVLAEIIGKDVVVVRLKASRLGLTEQDRDLGGTKIKPRKYENQSDRIAGIRAARKQWYAEHEHPRGFAGHRHRKDSIDVMVFALANWRATLSPAERSEVARKAVATKVERYGSGNPGAFGENAYSRVNRGYAEDIPGLHFRSQWEANYARFLDWLKAKGEIQDWAYESERFIFHGVTKAPVTYTPDFKVTENSGSVIYHEVKGWMDGPSKSKLKRMAKFYPDVSIIVIGAGEYKALAKWASLIPCWGDPVKERSHDEDE